MYWLKGKVVHINNSKDLVLPSNYLLEVAFKEAYQGLRDDVVMNFTLDGVFLPGETALLSYQSLLAMWEVLLDEYFSGEYQYTPKLAQDTALEGSEKNVFINVEFEKLFDIPVDSKQENLQIITQHDREGMISSIATRLDSAIKILDSAVTSVQQNFIINNNFEAPLSSTLPVINEPGIHNSPSAPSILIDDTFAKGFNSELLLNINQSISIKGNIFNDFGATYGAGENALGMNVQFVDPARQFSASNAFGVITLTSQEGNTLKLYTHTMLDFSTFTMRNAGDFVYTLNNAYITTPQPFFTEKFLYTLTNSALLSGTGTFNVQVIDDHPVASNQVGLSTLDEAHIPVVGTNELTSLNQLAGVLIKPSIDPLNPSTLDTNLSDNRIGANGGVVSQVSLNGVQGADPIVQISSTNNNHFTLAQIAFLNANGFTGSTINDPVIVVVDSLGNSYAVNTLNGQFIYTLNGAFHQNVSDSTSSVHYDFTFTDNEGQSSTAIVSFTVQDDAPIAYNVNAGITEESGLATGSDPDETKIELSGELIGVADPLNMSELHSSFGADYANASITKIELNGLEYTIVVNDTITVDDGHSQLVVNVLNGHYTFDLYDPYLNINNAAQINQYTFTFTDGDGSTDTGILSVTVNDDAPMANNVTLASITEADMLGGSHGLLDPVILTGNFITEGNSTFGADYINASITKIKLNGTEYTNVVNDTIVVDDGSGQLVFNVLNGDYTFTLQAPYQNVANAAHNNTYEITFTDGDGSTEPGELSITVEDDHPEVFNITAGTISETDLSGGSVILTGTFFINGNTFGADTANTNSIAITNLAFSNTDSLSFTTDASYTLSEADILIIGAGSGYKVTDANNNDLIINLDTGAYYYALNSAFHNNIANSDVTVTYSYTFTDSDGSTSTSADFSVIVQDDRPVANNVEPAAISETNLSGGDVILSGNILINGNQYGADGARLTNPITLLLAEVQNASVSTQSAADYTITAEDLAHLGLGAQVGDAGYKIIDTNTNELIVDLATGAYYYTLKTAFQNETADSNVTVIYSYSLFDEDGSPASANLVIEVEDDQPIANNVTPDSISEADILNIGSNAASTPLQLVGNFLSGGSAYGVDGASTTNPITLSLVVNNAGVVTYTTDNAYTLSPSDIAIVGAGAGYKISDSNGNDLIVNLDTGAYYYTLNAAFEKVNAGLDVTAVYTYTLTDLDGSFTSADLTITITDDSPHVMDLTPLAISEADLPGGANGSTDDVRVIGNLLVDLINPYGADGPANTDHITIGYSITASNTTINANGSAYVIATSDADILGSDTEEGHAAFKVPDELGNFLVVDLVTGAYYYELVSAFQNQDQDAPVTFKYAFTVTDLDGSTDEKDLTITIDNDTTLDPPVPPVVLDMNHDGLFSLLSPEQSNINYQSLSNEGSANAHVGWVSPEDGILMFDSAGTGQFTNLNQIAFTSYTPGAKTDLEGLKAFDSNHNDSLDIGDQFYNQFGVWQDKNTNAQTDEGEYQSLAQLGIINISLVSDHNLQIVNDNTIFGVGNYQTDDGEVHLLADVGLKIDYQDVVSDQPILSADPIMSEVSIVVQPVAVQPEVTQPEIL